MSEGWEERLARELGDPDAVEKLARLAPTDLNSLLLAVFARMAEQVTPARLLEQYQANRFVAPTPAKAQLLGEIDRLAWKTLPEGYSPVELSPVCPLGTNSSVATVSQHKVLSAARGTEVVADSTNVLALECAARRKALRGPERRREILLAASHRLLRTQAFSGPKVWPHFRVISLCAAGRDEGTLRFEARQLLEQISFHLQLIAAVEGLGVRFTRPRVALTDLGDGNQEQALRDGVLAPLAARFPEAIAAFDPGRQSGRGYYRRVCFKVYATDAGGQELELADGGDTDWTSQLLSDAKERLVISGIGTERFAAP